MKINLVRIDDRLIHGQVATVWSKEANAQRIVICSDEVAKDQIRKTLLLQVGPPGVKVSVVDVAKAVRVYNNPKYEKDTVFFLYTCPQDVLRMAEAGVPIRALISAEWHSRQERHRSQKLFLLMKVILPHLKSYMRWELN